jgi:hypothetical protein
VNRRSRGALPDVNRAAPGADLATRVMIDVLANLL